MSAPETAAPASATPAPESGALANASFGRPRIDIEVQQLFELNYQARTLRPGGQFDISALRRLVGGGYAGYTLPLFDREVSDAQAGSLRRVEFSDIGVSLDKWTESAGPGAGRADVTVTRTREEARSGGSPTRETATYQFRADRSRLGADGVRWLITDFLSPATGRWVSEPAPAATVAPASEAEIAAGLKVFFDKFYQARTLTSLHAIDLSLSEVYAAGSYADYTMPLLQQSASEAGSGALKEVRYADISVSLEKWDPKASDHGGLATVAVTRTIFVTRSSGAEPAQTDTYRFRVHQHRHYPATTIAYSGPRYLDLWLVVDFLRPDVNRWVTDIAGATTIIPDVGHY